MGKKLFVSALLLMLVFCASAQGLRETAERRYNKAAEHYQKREYSEAIKLLDVALKGMGNDYPDFKIKANALKAKCQQGIRALNTFVLEDADIVSTYQGGVFAIGVTSGKAWTVKSFPDWCICTTSNDSLFVTVARNEVKSPRDGKIVISNRSSNLSVTISQEARPEAFRKLKIVSSPMYARVVLDEQAGRKSPVTIDRVSAGEHLLSFSKDGYYSKDTVIVVPDELTDAPLEVHVALEPDFGTMRVNVSPEDGFDFDSTPDVIINGKFIDLNPARLNEFDADDFLKPYSLYTEGYIPLSEGTANLTVSSPGFETQTHEYPISVGKNIDVNIIMNPITGTLSISDENGLATGAEILIDGKTKGIMPSGKMRVKVGQHRLSLRKEGYDTREAFYPLDIREGLDTLVAIAMKPFGKYTITTDPGQARVIIDGELVGISRLEELKLLEGEHHIQIEKDDYITYDTTVFTNTSAEIYEMDIRLEQAHSFRLSADDDNTYATVTRGDKVFVKNGKLPLDVELPYSDSSFNLTATRYGRMAYKRRINFNAGTKDYYNIRTWSRFYCHLLGGNYYLNELKLFNDPTFKDYSRLADASVFQFRLFDGYSTAIARVLAYKAMNKKQDLTLPGVGKRDEDLVLSAGKNNYLLQVAPIFLNGEFRVGGAVADFVDASVLVSYAWSPKLNFIGNFTHLAGADIFVGAELSSRIPILNASLKLGMQMFKGNAEFAYDKDNSKGVYEKKIDTAQFVVTLGFSLGDRDSKGNNILRVF